MTTMMSTPLARDEVMSTLTTVIRELRPELALREIKAGTPLLEQGLGLDSIAIVELIGALEDRLGFAFDDSDLRTASFRDIGTLAGVIMQRVPPG